MTKLLKRAAAAQNGRGNVSQETFLYRVPLAKILANPYQTRITTAADHIIGLARSIWDLREDLPITHGLQQPPTARIVRQDGDDLIPIPRQAYRTPELLSDALTREDTFVQLFFGHSRHQAVRLLSGDIAGVLPQYADDSQLLPGPDAERYAAMPLMLAYADDEHMWSHAENENRQRKNTTAIEDALSLKLAMDTFGWKQEEAAQRAGMSRSAAANKLRLLNLPEDVQAKIQSGEISESHGRTLLTIADAPERVQALASTAGSMSRRELEEETAKAKAQIEAEREKERQIAAVRAAGITIPFYDSKADTANFEGFGPSSWWADGRLIETGVCSQNNCECLRLAYRPESWRTEISPLPDIAPNVRYGCVNHKAVRIKSEELGNSELDEATAEKQRQQEEAERQERIDAINANATALLDAFMDNVDVDAVWSSADWWEMFVEGLDKWDLRNVMIAAMKKHQQGNIEHMQAACLRAYAQGGTSWNQAISANVVDLKAIKNRIKLLGGIVAQRPHPRVRTGVIRLTCSAN